MKVTSPRNVYAHSHMCVVSAHANSGCVRYQFVPARIDEQFHDCVVSAIASRPRLIMCFRNRTPITNAALFAWVQIRSLKVFLD